MHSGSWATVCGGAGWHQWNDASTAPRPGNAPDVPGAHNPTRHG